jgi:DNA-binding response OmpR family regulator
MKQVLIIDAPDLLRDFIRDKLVSEQIEVHEATGRRDAFSKLVSELPDLVIIDVPESTLELIDFLKKKQENPNAKTIPAIILGPIVPKERLAILASLGVVKYFNKPIRFDVFFESVGRILRITFLIDTTPCILEVHLNNNIIFIEIARGLNREKISLLRFKIAEIIDANALVNPKAVVMMTDFELSFIDGANLELLFDNLIADTRLAKKNIKILSLNTFTKQLIGGHPQYKGIDVVSSLSDVLASLVGEDADDNADLVTNKILSASEDANLGSVEMRFQSESGSGKSEAKVFENVRVAVVDDETPVLQMLTDAFKNVNAKVNQYADGQTFLAACSSIFFDLVILDIMMPGVNGFEVLKSLAQKKYAGSVLVYSKVTQREAVLQAMQLGAKGYMVKPQTPEAIIKKSIETLNSRT